MKHIMLVMASVVICVATVSCVRPGSTASVTSKASGEKSVDPLSTPVATNLAATNNGMPVALDIFFRVPPPGFLNPESVAGEAVAKAQDLFRKGQTNAAVDLLNQAARDPACESGRAIVARKLIALLLYSDRVADAQAAYIACATNVQAAELNLAMVNGYLISEKRPEAAAEWAARLESLPLREPAACENLGYHLSSLAASGKVEEAIRRVPEVVARTNEVLNAFLLECVVYGMIGESEFQQAERFLSAVENATVGRNAYTGMVTNLRQTLEDARAKSASQAPGK